MSATVHKDMPPWPQLSYALAQHIIEKNIHIRSLTSAEAKQFESATVSFGRWVAFITDNTAGQLVSARVRALLFEQYIPHLYHLDKPCCRDERLDWDKICETARSLPSPHPSPIIPIKEENADADAETEPSTAISDVDAQKVPLNDVYHTLEYDLAAMLELRKLEEFEAQEEMENDEDKDHADESSLSLLNTHGNFNLKYLLQGIAANRDRTTLSDREIRNLLSDFKPHRTKWASDDKIGQEELYEACEKVLNDLKNFTEHSTPFLNKVSKREAPDYFDVIKKPMDLGTVTKKMKNLQYKSKKEFADDLYLIYDNCLTYNTNPASEYRKHAHAMRKKTDRLLARVPDITIRDRAEIEAEEFGDDASEDGDHDHRASRKGPGKHTHPILADVRAGSEPARGSRERSLTRESSTAPGNDIGTGSDNETGANTPNGVAPHKAYGGKQVKDNQAITETEEEGKDIDEDTENDLRELQEQIWRDMTRKTRAKMASEVEKQYQFPFADRLAISRSSLDMERFAIIEHQHCKPEVVQKLIKYPNDRFSRWAERNSGGSSLYDTIELDSSDDENLDVFFSRKMARATKEDQEDSARTDLFLPEYVITSGIPEIPNLPEDVTNEPQAESALTLRKASIDTTATDMSIAERPSGYTDVPLDVYPSVRFPNHGLNKLIDKNLKRLQKVRLVYSKCNAVRNNIPISTLASSIPLNEPDTLSTSSSLPALPWQNEDSDTKKIPPLIINQEAGEQLLQRTLVKLLAHAGFEGAQENALNVLTEIAMDYMLTIGKTLRVYWDDYGRQMNSEEILMHVLYENGVDNVAELESYIRDDIERYGNRLDELHRKLENSYQDMLLGPNEKSEDDESIIQDEESFITGSFGEELGEDFFGFKNIGLDQEYNVDALSIPARLWFGGNKVKEPRRKSSVHEPKLAYPPPPPFTPVTSETEFIGLLRPFIKSKMTEKGLVEDEYIPNKHKSRPKYPPTNKTNTGRKRPLKDSSPNSTGLGAGGLGGESRKTKRKRPLEEILAEKAERAEKKRQKMEEKAQRLAEKEEKRRLREELKEQERMAKQEAKERKAQAKRAATTTTTTS